MMICVEDNDIEIVKFLSENGGNVNLLDKKGQDTLHIAARIGNPSMVELLIKCGVVLNVKNNENYTALDIAEYHSKSEVAQILLKNGAINSYAESRKCEIF